MIATPFIGGEVSGLPGRVIKQRRDAKPGLIVRGITNLDRATLVAGFSGVEGIRALLRGGVAEIELIHTETPTPFSLNGAKGVGESGTIAVPAAVLNAVQDALGRGASQLTSIPLWPPRVLDALD